MEKQHIRIVCEVKDEAPYFIFTAIRERRKLKEIRTIPLDEKQQKKCKWMNFLPKNIKELYKDGKSLSILIHNGQGEMREYKVTSSRVYDSFEDLLNTEGSNTCIPGADFDEALVQYKKFYSPTHKFKFMICICLDEEIKISPESYKDYENTITK